MFSTDTVHFITILIHKERPMKLNQPIILCGYTSSGKTTIGTLLAGKLHYDFYDTDQMLIKQSQMTIPEIFAKGGEKLFRNLERKIVNQICLLGSCVVSTGGGMLAIEENAHILSAHGLIIYINRPFESCYQSLALHPERPLFQNHTKDELAITYQKRADIYSKYAAFAIENSRSPECAVMAIYDFLKTL